MQPLEIVLRLVAGAALVLANGFFVAIEFGLTRARQYSESEFAGAGLERAWEMTENLEIYLTGCQVGITAASISLGIVAEPALAAIFEPMFGDTLLASVGAGSFVAFLLVNLVHVVYGEQTPTYLGVERSKQVCRVGATPLYWFTRVIRPILDLGDLIAKWTLKLIGVEMTGAWLESEADVIEGRADLHHRLNETLSASGISDERHEEVMNTLAATEVPIRHVMVPRSDVVGLSTDSSPEENLDIIRNHQHRRYPLFGDDETELRGIVYLEELVNQFEEFRRGEVDIETLAEPPMTLSADTQVSDAFDRLQRERQEMALVEDEGELVGLLTATDAFEEVMGELEDPTDVSDPSDYRADSSGSRSRGDPA